MGPFQVNVVGWIHPLRIVIWGFPPVIKVMHWISTSMTLLSQRESHRAFVVPAPRERHPKPPVPNDQPASGQDPAISQKRNAVPREPLLSRQGGQLVMFQNH